MELFPCTPATPWTLLFATDEVTPGNVLRPDNRRKHHALYVSFLEFGVYLCKTSAWLPVGVLRSCICRRIVGGISAAVKYLLHSWFTGPGSLSQHGILLNPGQPVLLVAQCGRVICDGEAHRQLWDCKGASGSLPCHMSGLKRGCNKNIITAAVHSHSPLLRTSARLCITLAEKAPTRHQGTTTEAPRKHPGRTEEARRRQEGTKEASGRNR